ncbi:hypothetical protein P0D88_35490 [Paraburkholderia sp. RL18-103-BIB-C]
MSGKRDEEEEKLAPVRLFVTLVRVRAAGAGSAALYQCLPWGK